MRGGQQDTALPTRGASGAGLAPMLPRCGPETGLVQMTAPLVPSPARCAACAMQTEGRDRGGDMDRRQRRGNSEESELGGP